MKKYVISDTHFGHSNIIDYVPRRKEILKENHLNQTEVELDKLIIKNWNDLITNEDLVYFLGDFALCRDFQYKLLMAKSLKGKKVFIVGNHDKYSEINRLKELLKNDKNRIIDIINGVKIFKQDHYYVWLCHYPVNLPIKHYISIHGHVHQHDTKLNNQYNVSIDSQFLSTRKFGQPILINDIIKNREESINNE